MNGNGGEPQRWRDPFWESPQFADLNGELLRLQHAMQSGVLAVRQWDEGGLVPEMSRESGPKHLRVGVNSMMSDHGALVRLLIQKGIITGEEYLELCIVTMREEVTRYEKVLSEKLGRSIRLE